MIDANVYRQRIGRFIQPGQRKISMKNIVRNRKMKNEFKGSFLQILLLFSIVIYLEAIVNKQPQICLENVMKENHFKQAGYLINECPATWKICCIGSSSINNWYARCTYVNRNNRGIKLSHWNAGSAHLKNKLNEIESSKERW